MPTQVWAGQGTILKATIASTLTPIAQVQQIEGPEMTCGTIETTNLSSLVRTKRSQLPDMGSITFTIQYDPTDTTHQFLVTQVQSWPQLALPWELDFPVTPAKKGAFPAFVTKFGLKGFNQDDNMEADVELELAGAIVIS